MRKRPKKHFTPRSNWINDPNGLVFHNGYYHLFFQHNPFGNEWGHMSWGHARSKDLVSWEELPIAILENQDHMIFSGSAVFDQHNNRLIAFYTGHKVDNQSQYITHSYDDGITWLGAKKIIDLDMKDFRDPKVFRYRDHWLMVVAKPNEFLISFFASKDLVNWDFLSDFRAPGINTIYECPDLFEIDGLWVLFISTNPGGVAKGSGMYYIMGNFDGKEFQSTSNPIPVDYGPDFYAAVTFNGVSEKITIGWMNNWEYANQLSREIWNGSMTSARKLKIEKGRLIQEFIGSFETFFIEKQDFQFVYTNGSLKFYSEAGQLIIDRNELWDSAITKFSVPASAPYRVEALFDVGSIELSINGHIVTAQILVGDEVPRLERG